MNRPGQEGKGVQAIGLSVAKKTLMKLDYLSAICRGTHCNEAADALTREQGRVKAEGEGSSTDQDPGVA